jgi:TonB-linked SusC/RagA family outer membrane protein
MKNKLLRQFIMMSKWLIYGLSLQCLFISLLMASNAGAQQIKTVYEVQVNLRTDKARLIDILSEVENSTPFHFSFVDSDIAKGEMLTLNKRKLNVGELLMQISKQTGLAFRQVNNNINVQKNTSKQMARPVEVIIDGITITGRIRSAEDSEGLPGANVLVKGTSLGTVTDINGNYSLEVPSEESVIQISSVGYITEEVVVGNRTVIDLDLVPDITSLEEIVVVGYGTTRKQDLTGSVGTVDAEELNKLPISSLNQGLQGRVAGVQVTQDNGRPGGGVTVRVRGSASILGNNEPLYVIDGFPVNSETGSDDFASNPLASLNPNDIESVNVLKDASATAIYGSRAAGGVIIITTKKGGYGKKAQISFDSYYGVQNEFDRYDVLDGSEYARNFNLALIDQESLDEPFTEADIDSIGAGTDWADAVVRDNAPIQSYQLSVSGGGENVKYFVSGNYFDQEGILSGTSFNRISVRGNTEVTSGKLQVGSNISLSKTFYGGELGNSHRSQFGGGYIDVYLSPPVLPVFNERGTYTQISPYSNNPFNNPVEIAEFLTREQNQYRILANFYANYAFTDNLSLKVSVGGDVVADYSDLFYPIGSARSQEIGRAQRSNSLSRNWLNENVLTYSNVFNEKHALTAVAGFTYQTNLADFTTTQSNGLKVNTLGYYDLAGGDQDRLNVGTAGSEWVLLSYLGRLQYGFDDRYLFTLTGRYDGSSRFGANEKWGFFPAGAFAWNLSNESFMQGFNAVENIKLRMSYGASGNTALPPYGSLTQAVSRAQGTVDGRSVANYILPRAQVGNPDIGWETNIQANIGLDFSLFDQRLAITTDYYHRRTEDLLFNAPIIPLGARDEDGLVFTNIGSMENSGVELGIQAYLLTGSDFQWDVNFNLAYQRNEILSLGSDAYGMPVDSVLYSNNLSRIGASGNDDAVRILAVGQSLGAFYVLESDGIWDTQEEIDTYSAASTNPRVGGYRFVDQTGDSLIAASDRIIYGDAIPDFIGGITNNFSYKGFDLSIFFEYAFGHQIFNASRLSLNNGNMQYNITKDMAENAWTPDNFSTEYAVIGRSRPSPNTNYVEDAGYLKLRNITLGYRLPGALTQSIGLSSLRLYVSGSNLLVFTNYRGLDPDINSFGSDNLAVGIDYGSYPTSRIYQAGLQIQF